MSRTRTVAGVSDLDDGRYAALLRATGSYRERLVVRLAGEVGLRPAEMSRLRLADVRGRVSDGRMRYLLAVRDGSGERRRSAHLPESLKRDLERYAADTGIDGDEPLFDVTPRRLQMLVSSVADRAVEETGRSDLGEVSTADLRRRFGRRLLAGGGDPPGGMGVGGWQRLDGLAPAPETDESAIVSAFERAEAGTDGRFRAAFEGLEHATVLLDADGVVEYANRQFGTVTGVEAAAVVGRHLGELLSLPERDRTGMWETALAGDTWVGEAAWAVGEEDARGQVTLTGIGETAGGAAAFVLTFRPEGTVSLGESHHPERLRGIQAVTAEVGDAVADASTHEEVYELACETVADAPVFEFVWATEASTDGPAVPVAWENIAETRLERVALHEGEDGTPIADRATETGEIQERSVATPGDGGHHWLTAVPLTHGESVSGALVVGTEAPLDPPERAALSNLGSRIGGALAAVEWKRLLLADTVLELEFRTRDESSFFVAASAELDCEIRLEGLVPLEGESLLYYVTVAGVSPDRALSYTSEAVESARLVADYRDESLLEVTETGDSLARTLIDQGANVTQLSAGDGVARIVCETTPTAPVRAIAKHLDRTTPAASLVAKREVEAPVRTPTEFQRTLEEQLTERQLSVLRAAYHSGYFDWPRGSTAEELADSIGVSSPTLHNHLRRGQRKLLAAFFDDE